MQRSVMDNSVTWERVDRVLEHDLKTRNCVMQLKTSSRRLFAFVAIYSFLHRQMTKGSEQWCSLSAAKNLLRGVAKIIEVLETRVKHFRDVLDELYIERMREKHDAIDQGILMSRHMEITDPDKKIWKRMHETNTVPEHVAKAFEKVKHLLPNEAVANYQPRTRVVVKQEEQVEQRDYATISSADFYERYIRSDIVVAKSNKLSETYSEIIEIFPDRFIRAPRRIERFVNVEKANAVKNNVRFPSNYIRGMVLAYTLGEMFGGAFSAMQIYIMGFSNSASLACGNRVLDTSFSKLKTLLKCDKLFNANLPQSIPAFPFLIPITVRNEDARKTIFDAENFVPGRNEKAAVAVMSSTVAEHEPDGYMAVWLALAISKLVGRKVSSEYAMLFLVNWAAKQYQENDVNSSPQDYLKRLSTSVGITFDKKHGLLIPVVGFGCGLTNTKLRNYAVHSINQFIRKLLNGGLLTSSKFRENLSKMTFDELSAGLFKNNDVIKIGGEENVAPTNMEGVEFVPNEKRRRICEEEYNKALNPGLKLRFRFGVCCYQHPLPASSNKGTVIAQQLLKYRQIYAQRETAAATNWKRLIQFLFPSKAAGPNTSFAVARLMGLNRSFVEAVQTALKNAIPCERVLDNINIKFNADMLILGSKPDTFLRTKAGLIIGEHARHALEIANRTLCRYDECRRISNLHISELSTDSAAGKAAINMAHECVIAREHQYQYSQLQPFIPLGDNIKKFQPIPLFGIEDPIFPTKHSYVDKTATKCNDYDSDFFLDENQENVVDALRSRGILSLPMLLKNRNLKLDKECIKLLNHIWSINLNCIHTPRKYDFTSWSSKNTGQSGRSTTEFSPNSVIVLSYDSDKEENDLYKEEAVRGVNREAFNIGGIYDVFLAAVDTQHSSAENDIIYPNRIIKNNGGYMIQAPNISPVYRHGGKRAVITLKHLNSRSHGMKRKL